MSLNKVTLIGNLGKDPEIRTTTNGSELATFSLATSDVWKDKQTGERKEKTEWHRIVVYSPGLVGIVKQYIKKGTKIYLEGSLQTRKWTDNSGIERYLTEIVLQGFNSTLQILDSKNSSGGSTSGIDSSYYDSISSDQPAPANSDVGEFIDEKIDDDIPF